jgi:N-acetylglutamate synthase-like GNAT family acetyltransferase
MTVRNARITDNDEIVKVLKDVDEYHDALELVDFFVAEEDGRVVGVVKLEEYPSFFFLSSLAVPEKLQSKGTAGKILAEIFTKANKDIYIYTVIPEFFAKFGFVKTVPIAELPAKSYLECERCFPERCATMGRRAS